MTALRWLKIIQRETAERYLQVLLLYNTALRYINLTNNDHHIKSHCIINIVSLNLVKHFCSSPLGVSVVNVTCTNLLKKKKVRKTKMRAKVMYKILQAIISYNESTL